MQRDDITIKVGEERQLTLIRVHVADMEGRGFRVKTKDGNFICPEQYPLANRDETEVATQLAFRIGQTSNLGVTTSTDRRHVLVLLTTDTVGAGAGNVITGKIAPVVEITDNALILYVDE